MNVDVSDTRHSIGLDDRSPPVTFSVSCIFAVIGIILVTISCAIQGRTPKLC